VCVCEREREREREREILFINSIFTYIFQDIFLSIL
jgi:hypothetical protein